MFYLGLKFADVHFAANQGRKKCPLFTQGALHTALFYTACAYRLHSLRHFVIVR